MGKKTAMNLLERAMRKKEMHKYLKGENDYSIFGLPNEYGDPTDYKYILQAGFFRYYEEKHDENIIKLLNDCLLKIMDDSVGIYSVINILSSYLWLRQQEAASFSIDVEQLARTLRGTLLSMKNLLIEEKRWCGSDWNPVTRKLEPRKMGLWHCILSIGKHLFSKYKVNILPEDAWEFINSNPDKFENI